jgi:membrane peptidoglycan carboxypeptidase
MVATGSITAADRAAAITAPLELRAALDRPIASHFVALARDEAEALVPDLEQHRGVVIETTLDAGLQAAVERQALLQLNRLERKDAGSAAVVVLDPRDGRILAMAANVSTSGVGAEFNMALEPRQPGSALKPFLYSLALEDGFTAASPLLDVPQTFGSGDLGYSPQNYDQRFRGITTLRTALASSLNVPAVWMLEQVGTTRFTERLRAFGIATPLDPQSHNLALALGSADVSLLDLTAAYGTLANGGELYRPVAVTRIRDGDGKVLYERPEPTGRPVVSPEVAFLLSDILADDGARSAGFGAGSILQLPFPAAVKTGTTTDFHDNWTLGFTPRQVVGVWVGNVDSRPMHHISGVDGAAPIWAEVMKATRALQGAANFEAPPSLVRREVCSPTGLAPGANCPTTQLDWFLPSTVPTDEESYYVRDDSGRLAINPPAAAAPWLALGGYLIAGTSTGTAGLAIASPADGSVLYLAPELAAQEVAVRLACPSATSTVEIYVDGNRVATTAGCPGRVSVPLEPGVHTLLARASVQGSSAEASISYEVRR